MPDMPHNTRAVDTGTLSATPIVYPSAPPQDAGAGETDCITRMEPTGERTLPVDPGETAPPLDRLRYALAVARYRYGALTALLTEPGHPAREHLTAQAWALLDAEISLSDLMREHSTQSDRSERAQEELRTSRDWWEAEARDTLTALCREDTYTIARVARRALALRAESGRGECPVAPSTLGEEKAG